MKLQKKKLRIPIFNIDVVLLFGDINVIVSYLEDYHNTHFDFDIDIESADAVCFTVDGIIYICWDNSKKIEIPILGHEICHAVYSIINLRGLSINDQEVFCYLFQYIMEEILCILHEPMVHLNLQKTEEDIHQS